MKKQGSIILGIGGDNSHGGVGTFYVWLALSWTECSLAILLACKLVFRAFLTRVACHAQEGVMTGGYASNETDAAVQANSE